MMNVATQLGLTPLARSRISIPHLPSGSGKFRGLLAGEDD
jgi:hypothetical protein